MNVNITYDEKQLQLLFDVQQASIIRTKNIFSLVFISFHYSPTVGGDKDERYETLYSFVSKHSRNTDRVYRHPSKRFIIVILPFSGDAEAQAYFKKLVANIPNSCLQKIAGPVDLVATTNEIANTKHSLEEVINYNVAFFRFLEDDTPNVAYTIDAFSEAPIESIRVSILENNEIAMSILKNSIQNINIQRFDLQLETFTDGLQFIDSYWHQSGHTHIVIVNDTLPFKNGLEVISYLRARPNDEKYIILLISKRASEEAIIYAYNNGVDAYFTRPFNIRLLEAQMKNLLRRLR